MPLLADIESSPTTIMTASTATAVDDEADVLVSVPENLRRELNGLEFPGAERALLSTDANNDDGDAPSATGSRIELTPDQVLDKYGARNAFILFVWLSMGSVWGANAMPMMVSAFLMAGGCSHSTDATNCTLRPGSIAYEFDLVGARAKYLDYMTSAYLAGVTFGSAILPTLSDRKGRRPVVLLCLLFVGVFGECAALASSITSFTALRFFQGAFFTGCGVTNWVLAYESVPLILRSYTALTFGLFWVVGYFAVAPLAYLLPKWRWLMAAVSAPSLLTAIAYYFTVPDSFHFTVSRRPRHELKRWIRCANYFATPENRVALGEEELCDALCRHRNEDASSNSTTQKNLLRSLVENRVLLVYTSVMAYLWTCDTFVYYGLSLYSARLAGDEFINFGLMALIEIPSYLISPLLLDTLGRRFFVSFCHFLAAISFFLVIFCKGEALRLCVWLMGKFAISCAFTCLFVFASELFPTVVRNGCIGVCTVIACMGGVLAPVVQSMSSISAIIPTLIFGVSAALGGALTLILPETRNTELPDSANEIRTRRPSTVSQRNNYHPHEHDESHHQQ